MNERELLFHIGEIDDAYIREAAQTPAKKRAAWLQWVAVAACVALVVTASVGAYSLYAPREIVYPQVDKNVVYLDGCLAAKPEKQSFAELAAGADLIVVADVREALHTPMESGAAICYARVDIREVLKGAVRVGETIGVHDNAVGYTYYMDENGEIRETDEVVGAESFCGGPLMAKGNRVLLFLKRNDDNAWSKNAPYEIVPAESGKFYFDSDGKYHNSMLYCAEYSQQMYEFGSRLADIEPKTVDEIKALIGGEDA